MVMFTHGLSGPPLGHDAPRRQENPLTRPEIVVGYDGSPDADLAVEWATHAAAARGEAVRVLVVSDLDDSASRSAEVRRAAQERFAPAGPRSRPVVSVERLAGAVGPTLVEAAADSSMLVLGSRGHTMAARVLVGSVSQQSARHGLSPVVVVRPAADPEAARVVVGLDGLGSGSRAVDFACRHASATGQPVTLLRAHRTPDSVPVDEHGNVPDSLSAALLDEERLLDEAVATARQRFPALTVEGDLLAIRADRALVEASRHATMVVLGARSQHPVVEAVLGAVSRHVLQHAHCPVAVVR